MKFDSNAASSAISRKLSLIAIIGCLSLLSACRKSDPKPQIKAAQDTEIRESSVAVSTDQADEPVVPQSYEVTSEQLLGARLSRKETSAGWIRLFDGYTLFGWDIVGPAKWSIEDQSIVVAGDDPTRLFTAMPWQNFELELQVQTLSDDADVSLLVRSPIDSFLPAQDYYEINLTEKRDGYPVGSVNERQASTADPQETLSQWHSLRITADSGNVNVSLDGKLICQYDDPEPTASGRIGLQHQQGKARLREIRLRPLGMESLLDKELSQWKKYPEMPGSFSTNDQGHLRVEGGRTQLETQQSYGDFVLLAEYRFADEKDGGEAMNSGIFFRCIPGDEMMGYECQLSNAIKDNNPLSPADHGTGGIFRRQEARIVAGNVNDWSSVVLMANGPSMAAWVEGIQVSQWYDDRPANENPRRGARVEPGTIMIQGHDPGTDATLKQITIVSHP